MGNLLKSKSNNIISPNGNSLAVYIDSENNLLFLKDVLGNTEPLSNYFPQKIYGSFYDTSTQNADGNSVPTVMKYNSTEISNGVEIVDNTKITVSEFGVYNIQFSAQLDRIAGSGVVPVDIWFRKNGDDIPNSNTKVTMSGNANQSKIVASWNYVTELSVGDDFEIVWLTPTTNIKLIAEPENTIIPYPAIPSVILTVFRV